MRTQGGWLTARGLFLSGAVVVLGALVLFGLLTVKERSETARREAAIEVAQQQLEEESNREVAITEEAASDDGSEQVSPPPAEELPATGLDGISVAVSLAGLTYSGALYVTSRRSLLRRSVVSV